MESQSKLARYVELARHGAAADVDTIVQDLDERMTFADSRFIDYALGLVKTQEGVERIEYYLFNGTQIQRNYATLFFNRRCEKGDWDRVKRAYQMGLIDQTQAFSK